MYVFYQAVKGYIIGYIPLIIRVINFHLFGYAWADKCQLVFAQGIALGAIPADSAQYSPQQQGRVEKFPLENYVVLHS